MSTGRVDVSVGTSCSEDINRAINVAMDLMHRHPRVLKDPAPAVAIIGLGDSSVKLALRAWVNNTDYWGSWGT